MPTEIAPFRSEHLDAAAALLAARMRQECAAEPHLSAQFVDPATARAYLQSRLAAANGGGIVALHQGHLAGYMLAAYVPSPGLTAVPHRYARIWYHDHAASGEERGELYRTMYAALSPAWLAAGYFCHVVNVPAADREAREAWMSVGFGQHLMWLRRAIAPVPRATLPPGVKIRRGEAADLDAVAHLVSDLFRHHANVPSYIPYLPEFELARRREHEVGLSDPTSAHWLAERDGKALGVAIFEPTSLPSMRDVVPERSIYLADANTEAAARGSGIGTALLARGLAWAEAEGYEWCHLAVVAGNLVGVRFWRRLGFEPFAYTLLRVVDERIAWARG